MSEKGKLTDWECGQDLIEISDLIGEKMGECKLSHPKVYWMLDELRRTLGDHFNDKENPFGKSHGFGLTSHNEEGNQP